VRCCRPAQINSQHLRPTSLVCRLYWSQRLLLRRKGKDAKHTPTQASLARRTRLVLAPAVVPGQHPYHTRLKFFGHIARADPSMDHSLAPRSVQCGPLTVGLELRRSNRPRQTGLRAVEFNIGSAAAYHRAQNRQTWRSLVKNGNVRSASHMTTMTSVVC